MSFIPYTSVNNSEVVLVGDVFGAVDEGEDDVPKCREGQTLTWRGTLTGFNQLLHTASQIYQVQTTAASRH